MAEANIFNTEKIFYTMIDKEVYAVRILDMYIPLNDVLAIASNTISLGKQIHSVKLSIAGKDGIKVFNHSDSGTKEHKDMVGLLCNTYKTIDDCVYQCNPVFKYNIALNRLSLTESILCLMEDICPSRAKWEMNYDNTFSLVCWHWDGIKPVKDYFHSPSNDKYAYGNRKRVPLYNIVKDSWLVNVEDYKNSYPTFDSCLSDKRNVIKVHLF